MTRHAMSRPTICSLRPRPWSRWPRPLPRKSSGCAIGPPRARRGLHQKLRSGLAPKGASPFLIWRKPNRQAGDRTGSRRDRLEIQNPTHDGCRVPLSLQLKPQSSNTMSIQYSALRPGLLVGLRTSITGNVQYFKEVIEATHIDAKTGAQLAEWNTRRKIDDPEEAE